MRESARGRTRWPFWGTAGLLLLGAGIWALVEDVPVANVVWYLPA